MTDFIKTRNNVNRLGQGKETLMFAHGYGCNQNMWRYITPAFEQDYDIVLFDHVGSGKSDDSAYDFDKYDSLEGFADDIIEICDALELSNVHLVGHSVSAIIGGLATIKRPGLFKSLIMIGPSPRYINTDNYYGGFTREAIDELMDTLEHNFMGWSRYITPVIAGNDDQPQIAEELHDSFCRMQPGIAQHFAKVTFLGDNREDLSKIPRPTLVLQCNPDFIAPVEVGQYVHQQIPESTYTQIEASGHTPHLTAPESVINAMQSFFEVKRGQ